MPRPRKRSLRSPEKLGLTMSGTGSPALRAMTRVSRLEGKPSGAFEWKELRDEFNLYLRLFPVGAGTVCKRCGHPKRHGTSWVHLPDAIPGDRVCQPDGVLCDCVGFVKSDRDVAKVALDARYVRRVANRMWRGKTDRLPSFAVLRNRMEHVFSFVHRRTYAAPRTHDRTEWRTEDECD